MPSKISLFIVLAVISMASAAPYIFRYRRAIEEPVDPLSDEPAKSENIQSGSRQAKVLNFFNTPTLEESDKTDERTKLITKPRQNKALSFFNYVPQYFAGDDDYADDDLTLESGSESNEEDDISRTIPARRKPNPYKDFSNTNSLGFENSPIYYIRLPPTPYMFVPGLGYVSNPPSIGPPVPQQVNPFINLPIDFVSNGKPTNVYQWNGAPSYQTQPINTYNPIFNRPAAPRPQVTRPNNQYYQRPTKRPLSDSKITTLNKGPYPFNGKPNDIFVLRDSYNSLYSDALQNFYP